MQLKAQGPEPVGDCGPKISGLVLGVTVNNDVIARVEMKRLDPAVLAGRCNARPGFVPTR